ncbi:MAG: FKBP-type peptidyl-prolyl cis-trans isomerase [Sphingobacteriaceae bacterium]|nr:MAG: FKBP-type peptidyl-prolyl cis-trans isomerase [Pedobacter sp.]
MNKKIMLMVSASLVSLSAMSQVKKGSSKKVGVETSASVFKSQLDSASYAFGYNISQDLKIRGFTEVNYNLVSKALADGFQGTNPLLTKEECQKVIGVALASANKVKYASVLEEGQKYLAENKKKPGVTTLPSGLQYEVLGEGTGDKPKATDQVTVHYKGTLINGKQFDSSYDRKEPATFALNGVIPGWTEGVQLMSVGSKYHFVIPYQLAYGENGRGQDILPYSVLIFDIELIKIVK